MRKSYLDIIISFQKEHIKDFGEFGFKLASEFFEKTIVWIIGLSSGTIVLILATTNSVSGSDFNTTIARKPTILLWAVFIISIFYNKHLIMIWVTFLPKKINGR